MNVAWQVLSRFTRAQRQFVTLDEPHAALRLLHARVCPDLHRTALLIAWRSILRRDVPRHEAFMIRAYALGQGAGTQVLVLLPWMFLSGESGGLTRDLLMTLSWAINIVLAESIIRYRAARRAPRGRSRLAPTARGAALAAAQ
jgi:hypothetical protein